jgi:hypothetical protein
MMTHGRNRHGIVGEPVSERVAAGFSDVGGRRGTLSSVLRGETIKLQKSTGKQLLFTSLRPDASPQQGVSPFIF